MERHAADHEARERIEVLRLVQEDEHVPSRQCERLPQRQPSADEILGIESDRRLKRSGALVAFEG